MSDRIVKKEEDWHGDQDTEASQRTAAVAVGWNWRKRSKHRTYIVCYC
jgi:hypothetical protein